jgi:isoleucyl-tRNA synthetase
MKFPNYQPEVLEPAVLAHWKKHNIVENLRKRNKNGKKFYFLDGPPYTSGKFHLGHAWNYALKDLMVRYKRMHKFNVWDRNGFDVHGLPTEHKVMDKYDLKTKEDIEKFGVDKFVTECEKYCLEMANLMTKDLTRMGISLKTDNPYMALKPEFMEGEWALIKKAYEKELLYYGEKVLTWCQHCETAVAKHECEYKNVNDKSIFVKFPIKDKKNEFLIIWTTTPWTIPFNLAVMVNPELDYVKVEVEGEVWYLAKALAGVVVQAVADKKMKLLEEFKGEKLEGLEYQHPFEKYISKYAELKKDHKNVHTVIMSKEFVDTSSGSGLVHSAPGCGPEDQEACKPYDIPPFNALAENGFFSKDMGKFSGLRAKVDDNTFIGALKKEGALIATTQVEHEYPHCWRCKNPIVFRITFQWFFSIEKIKNKILKENKGVNWVPDTALNAYESWVGNLKDNSISRQRYWGTPLPIWECTKCEKRKVIGSREELKKLGGKVPKNIHIPWINEIELKCECNSKMKRVSDVIDVWIDAGTASWNCLDNDPKLMKEWYPADYIMEAKEQTRLWFSMLSICSYIYLDKKAFQNVYVYGMLNDIEGKKMSKSLGNIISPYEMIDKYGVDVLRYYMCQNNAGQDINFSWDECKVKQRQLHILWNVHKLLINLAKENDYIPKETVWLNNSSKSTDSNKSSKSSDSSKSNNFIKKLAVEEKYILSKLNSTIEKVTSLLESYKIDQMILPLEELYLELSRTYIQMVRDKSSLGSKEEKELCINTIYHVLLECLKMFNIVIPFISEAIYLNLKEEFKLKEESISHFSWPKANLDFINTKLETEMEEAKQIIQAALHAREKAHLGLRWPVKEMILVGKTSVKKLKEVILRQTNCKSIKMTDKLEGVKISIKPNFSKIGPAFGKLSPLVIKKLNTVKADKIMQEIEKNGKYTFKLEGNESDSLESKDINITNDMLQVEHEVPSDFQEGEFKTGFVYINTERNDELEAEGYAREVTRQVQQLRKEAGLQKTDKIRLHIKGKRIEKYLSDIKEKVGAIKLDFGSANPQKEFKKHSKVNIKNESYSFWFEKA